MEGEGADTLRGAWYESGAPPARRPRVEVIAAEEEHAPPLGSVQYDSMLHDTSNDAFEKLLDAWLDGVTPETAPPLSAGSSSANANHVSTNSSSTASASSASASASASASPSASSSSAPSASGASQPPPLLLAPSPPTSPPDSEETSDDEIRRSLLQKSLRRSLVTRSPERSTDRVWPPLCDHLGVDDQPVEQAKGGVGLPTVERPTAIKQAITWIVPLSAMLWAWLFYASSTPLSTLHAPPRPPGAEPPPMAVADEADRWVGMLFGVGLALGLYYGILSYHFPISLRTSGALPFLKKAQAFRTLLTLVPLVTDVALTAANRSYAGPAYRAFHVAILVGCSLNQLVCLRLVHQQRFTWKAQRASHLADGLLCWLGQSTTVPELRIGFYSILARSLTPVLAALLFNPATRVWIASTALTPTPKPKIRARDCHTSELYTVRKQTPTPRADLRAERL
jgi:hypothetical protein